MEFIKSTDGQEIASYIAYRIGAELEMDKNVLLFMPGGSAIPIVRDILIKLAEFKLDKLALTLTDERYGDPGHQDENWASIMRDKPVLKGARCIPINNGESLEQTTKQHEKSMKELLEWADHCIGFFGIGADGHTAGILPKSPASQSANLIHSYEAAPFIRITITPKVITHLNDAFVYAMGSEKHDVLDMLELPIDTDIMPAQLLKSVPELIIFNDYKGKQL